MRPDFGLVNYATAHHVRGEITPPTGSDLARLATRPGSHRHVDVQISLDGATAEVNDAIRGTRSFDGGARMRTWRRGGLPASGLGCDHPAQRRPARQFATLAKPLRNVRIAGLRPSGAQD